MRWRSGGRNNNKVTVAEGLRPPSFDDVIRRMEEDIDEGVHHTILRYCADVLGSLRREEFRNLRRQLQQRGQPILRGGNGGRSGSKGSCYI